MSVYLLRNYSTFAASATVPVTLPDATEAALIAQGLATAAQTTVAASLADGPDLYITQGGNVALLAQAGQTTPAFLQGNSLLPNISLGSLALTSYETNGVAQTAGDVNLSEIFVPYWNTWKGVGVLNGTTVGTNKWITVLYGTSGVLLANSAVAGTLSTGASVMQNLSFVSPILLAPGRYFIGVQADGGTDTIRHVLSANGSNVICTKLTSGTFGTIPATMTVPTTFTTAIAPICQLFTV